MPDILSKHERGVSVRSIVMHPVTLWVAFAAVQLWLGVLGLYAPGQALGDVSLYGFWVKQAFESGTWVGITDPWVYPILAIVPMIISSVFGFGMYLTTWLWLVFCLNVVAFGFAVGWRLRPERIAVGWWWTIFLFLLGPIALARIDSITVPIALIGALLIAARPLLASALLAIATWMKIWPAALIVAAIVAFRERVAIIAGAVAVTGLVLVAAFILGGAENVLSFLGQQTGRGLQVEAPVSTIWMWMARAGVPGASAYYDNTLLTYQVLGPGVETVVTLMTPLLAIVVAVIALVAVFAVRRGAEIGDVFAPASLALVVALIGFNKVGSPQFVSWLAVPVVLGLVASATGNGRSFRIPAVLVAAIAGLTHVLYPYLYLKLVSLSAPMIMVLTVRNILFFAVLAWALHALVTAWRWSDAAAGAPLRRRSVSP